MAEAPRMDAAGCVDPREEAANEELRQRLCKELDHMEKEQPLRGTPHYRGHIGTWVRPPPPPGPRGRRAPRIQIRRAAAARLSFRRARA